MKQCHIDDDKRELERSNMPEKMKRSAMAVIQRQFALWMPIASRLMLVGIKVTDDDGDTKVLIAEPDRIDALRQYWATTFSVKVIN